MPVDPVTTGIRKERPEDGELLERFKKDISIDADASQLQRQQAHEDMQFLNTPGGMWDGRFEKLFQNRVKMQFPLISNFLYRTIGEWNQNRIGVEFRPDADLETSDKDAKFANGKYRADFRRRGQGKKALDNAVLEMFHCGFGSFLLAEQFDDLSDLDNANQHIEFRALFDAYMTVYWDESSQDIDNSDATRCTILTRYTDKSFKTEFGEDEEATSAYDPADIFDNINSNLNSFTQNPVYVATRYEKFKSEETFFSYNNFETGLVENYSEEDHSEIEDQLKQNKHLQFASSRKILKEHVEKTVFSGSRIFEGPRRISGRLIPVVSVYGYRVFVDGVSQSKGIIRDLKDPSRLYNQQVSQVSEKAASSNAGSLIFNPDQMIGTGIEESWIQPNKPFKIVNPSFHEDGTLIAKGPVGEIPPTPIDPNIDALLKIVPTHIDRVAGGPLQEAPDPQTSGKAFREARKIQDLTTQPLMENIATSVEWCGEIYLSKAPEIYNTPRAVRVMERDGTESTVQMMQQIEEESRGFIEINTFQKKRLNAYADTSPQYETQRVENTDVALKLIETFAPLIQIIPTLTPLIQELAGDVFQNMSGDFSTVKEVNRKQRLASGTIEPETDEEKDFVAQTQKAQAEKKDPQAELLLNAAKKEASEARNFDAGATVKVQDAQKKAAETQQILSETEIDRATAASDIGLNEQKVLNETAKIGNEIRKDILKPLEDLPIE